MSTLGKAQLTEGKELGSAELVPSFCIVKNQSITFPLWKSHNLTDMEHMLCVLYLLLSHQLDSFSESTRKNPRFSVLINVFFWASGDISFASVSTLIIDMQMRGVLLFLSSDLRRFNTCIGGQRRI